MEAAILVFDGVDELDAVGPYEVLQRAAAKGAPLDVRLVTLAPAEQVTGAFGLRLEPDGVLGDRVDLLVVPGGGWAVRAERGAWAEAQRPDVPDAIARAARAGATVASVCTGAMLVAAAGLTRGRAATTHQSALADLRQTGAEVVEARVVDDGELVSAGGVTSGIDLALWLVERFFGADLAEAIARELEHDRVGPVHVTGARSPGASGP
jgi:transcriptional regulator GlxA family with amidase domain